MSRKSSNHYCGRVGGWCVVVFDGGWCLMVGGWNCVLSSGWWVLVGGMIGTYWVVGGKW